jgi:YfiH family protein
VGESPFLRSRLVESLGIEHGFGSRGSENAAVPDLITARQVHGTRVVEVPPLPSDPEADALLTLASGQGIGVLTADCVPVVLAQIDGAGVAIVHAGWRGSARRITQLAVRALAESTGCRPEALVAAIGPHIGPCCYEVDEPVREAVGPEPVFAPSERPGHYQLDLFELNRRQLLQAGVIPDRIERVGGCTSCDTDLFYSYRRDGPTGRLTHYVRKP